MKYFVVLIVILFSLTSYKANAQNHLDEIKQQQRATTIFNLAEQITWPSNNFKTFTIGLLDNNFTKKQLLELSKKKSLKGKPVKIVYFETISDIKNIQLLYINKIHNFNLDLIKYKAEGNAILLITEGYDYNSSMINLLNINSSFKYDLNGKALKSEGFKCSSVLKKYAISSFDEWTQFYRNAVDESIVNPNIVFEHSNPTNTNEASNQELFDSINELEATDVEFINITDLEEKHLEEKLLIEKRLEKKIRYQQQELQNKEIQLEATAIKIEQQEQFLKQQEQEIAHKQVILKEKDLSLSTQRKIIFLASSLLLLSLIGGYIIYRKNKTNKQLATSLKEKSKQLEIKNKEVEQFAYIASHDLKEPLTTINGIVNIMQDDFKEQLGSEGLTSLSFIEQSCDRMYHQIMDLLQYSKMGKSKNKEAVDCMQIVKNIELDLSNVITRQNAKIMYNKLPTINASKLELRTVFQNLINNGIKFKKLNVDPVVKISYETTTKNNTDYWVFSVKDNGIGIDEKHKEKIFAIFQRLHSAEQYEGTGIGLAYCKKIVENLGGEIWLDSTVGKGSQFYFSIPK